MLIHTAEPSGQVSGQAQGGMRSCALAHIHTHTHTHTHRERERERERERTQIENRRDQEEFYRHSFTSQTQGKPENEEPEDYNRLSELV